MYRPPCAREREREEKNGDWTKEEGKRECGETGEGGSGTEQMDEGERRKEREREEGVCVDRYIERERGDRKTVSMETRKEPL